MHRSLFLLTVFGVFSCLMIACTAGEGIEGEGYDALTPQRPKYAKVDSGAARSNPPSPSPVIEGSVMRTEVATDSGTPAPVNNACSAQPTKNTCDGCCLDLFPLGDTQCNGAFLQAFGDCNCVAPVACASACRNSFCRGLGIQDGSACAQCLDASAACFKVAYQAAPECEKFDRCYDEQCASKAN